MVLLNIMVIKLLDDHENLDRWAISGSICDAIYENYTSFVISFTLAGIFNPNILHAKIMKTPKNYNK